jgi:hypothetical protein
MSSFTKEHLKSLKTLKEEKFINKVIDDFVEKTKVNILYLAENSSSTSYEVDLYFTNAEDLICIEHKESLRHKLRTIFPDSIISFTFVLQLPDGTWSRDHVYNPKIDYKSKQLKIRIDWQ